MSCDGYAVPARQGFVLARIGAASMYVELVLGSRYLHKGSEQDLGKTLTAHSAAAECRSARSSPCHEEADCQQA